MTGHSGIDPVRVCSVCAGPVDKRNKRGICTRNAKCRSEGMRARSKPDARRPRRRRAPEGGWLLQPAYDLEDGSEIIDDVAIQIAFGGSRKVRLTETERQMTVKRMILSGCSVQEMADHLGTIPGTITRILEGLGYETIRDQMQDSYPHHKVIVPRDRERGPKMLEAAMPVSSRPFSRK